VCAPDRCEILAQPTDANGGTYLLGAAQFPQEACSPCEPSEFEAVFRPGGFDPEIGLSEYEVVEGFGLVRLDVDNSDPFVLCVLMEGQSYCRSYEDSLDYRVVSITYGSNMDTGATGFAFLRQLPTDVLMSNW